MKMRVRYRYPTQKVPGLFNMPVSRLDEMASVLSRAFKHDKGPIWQLCHVFGSAECVSYPDGTSGAHEA